MTTEVEVKYAEATAGNRLTSLSGGVANPVGLAYSSGSTAGTPSGGSPSQGPLKQFGSEPARAVDPAWIGLQRGGSGSDAACGRQFVRVKPSRQAAG